ncbi:MAG: hypothetical protein OXJ90_24920 [Spirochaetaceae bacterium]|nr:hypothetical protein [Spirochaetaceae bacterium]
MSFSAGTTAAGPPAEPAASPVHGQHQCREITGLRLLVLFGDDQIDDGAPSTI